MGYAGAVITPFYDSLLVKLTASGQTFEIALQRMDRALREFRIRGVKTNIPFLENLIHNETFRAGQATTTLIDNTPELFAFKPRRDRATKLLNFLGDVIVNGNPHAKGHKLTGRHAANRPAGLRSQSQAGQGHARLAARTGAEEIRRMDVEAKATARHRHDLPRCASIAHGHAGAQLRHAGGGRRCGAAHAANCSRWKCGAARRSTPRCAFCAKIPWERLRALAREGSEHLFPDALPRQQCRRLLELSRQRRRRLREARRRVGHGYFPHLRFAELPAEPEGGDGSGAGHARDLRSGDLLHRRHSRSASATSIRCNIT